jgi:intracellular sulfur oxidation DsrE/DsrF family protein
MKNLMKKLWMGPVVALAVLMVLSTPAPAQSLPVPGYGAAKDIPGAQQMPDPAMTYKVVFDISHATPKIDQVNPGLITVARYLNTLAAHGVPADHRQFVVVLHQGGTDMALDNAAFRARHNGHDNPDIALIRSLTNAGVEVRVCGQAVLARKIDPKTIQSDIHLDLWALSTIVNYQLEGYVHIGSL